MASAMESAEQAHHRSVIDQEAKLHMELKKVQQHNRAEENALAALMEDLERQRDAERAARQEQAAIKHALQQATAVRLLRCIGKVSLQLYH